MEASGLDAKIAAVLRGTADAKASVQKTKETVTQLRFRVTPQLLLLHWSHTLLQ